MPFLIGYVDSNQQLELINQPGHQTVKLDVFTTQMQEGRGPERLDLSGYVGKIVAIQVQTYSNSSALGLKWCHSEKGK